MAVIYKILNKVSGKCYIGETKEKDPYTRWNQHLSNIRRGVGCPALRDAFQKYGEEAFEFRILFFCFDEDRFHHEIATIAKYNSQVPNGYNIAKGGQGGPLFKGKKHSIETIQKIQDKMQKYYKDPEWIRRLSERTKCMMSSQKARTRLSNSLKTSVKFRKAIEEGRVGGGCREYTPEIRKKISDSLKEYYKKEVNKSKVRIENHRKSMAKAVGVKVYQYNGDTIINKYESISEAARTIQKHKSGIQVALDKPNRKGYGFIWRTTPI